MLRERMLYWLVKGKTLYKSYHKTPAVTILMSKDNRVVTFTAQLRPWSVIHSFICAFIFLSPNFPLTSSVLSFSLASLNAIAASSSYNFPTSLFWRLVAYYNRSRTDGICVTWPRRRNHPLAIVEGGGKADICSSTNKYLWWQWCRWIDSWTSQP